MRDLITAGLMLFGASFMLLATVGIVRLPDLFIRMHAATKSGTLGVTGMILALAVHFNDLGIAIRSLLVILFIFLTAPVAAHLIARAAYLVGVPLWEKTVTDELRSRYGEKSREEKQTPAK
ncbi:MAG: monovalent cation/H(+) antiporter subunit G [Candidatus Hydrogenedentes bacterium]|nr:monovalent cation/H(+) antiporter subunit G [Candidatus Hydrogenedentota bacterium]